MPPGSAPTAAAPRPAGPLGDPQRRRHPRATAELATGRLGSRLRRSFGNRRSGVGGCTVPGGMDGSSGNCEDDSGDGGGDQGHEKERNRCQVRQLEAEPVRDQLDDQLGDQDSGGDGGDRHCECGVNYRASEPARRSLRGPRRPVRDRRLPCRSGAVVAGSTRIPDPYHDLVTSISP